MGEQTEITITCIKEEEPKFKSVFNILNKKNKENVFEGL